ncbi:hypothetical protein OG871_27430 [Kitasatospora sp. NBC_00374]|uniref:hypothetical protein n=1 Tax=Kitasatospora sp. NBC_00374 TaxID=2975964 RepID=UPI0032523CDD
MLGAVCFLLGFSVGGAVLYLLQHRAEIGQPLDLGILAIVSLAALATADRLINHRTTPPKRTSTTSGQRPPAS